MNYNQQIIAKRPADCSDVEIQDFIALVLAGGEVITQGLEDHIRNAQALILGFRDDCLQGIAGVKNPRPHYRHSVSIKAGLTLSESDFPYELGWVFVTPSARKVGLGNQLVRSAVANVSGTGIFATSWADNEKMHNLLIRHEFERVGEPYASERSDRKLILFTRVAAHHE